MVILAIHTQIEREWAQGTFLRQWKRVPPAHAQWVFGVLQQGKGLCIQNVVRYTLIDVRTKSDGPGCLTFVLSLSRQSHCSKGLLSSNVILAAKIAP
jgi:hypothetical protein